MKKKIFITISIIFGLLSIELISMIVVKTFNIRSEGDLKKFYKEEKIRTELEHHFEWRGPEYSPHP